MFITGVGEGDARGEVAEYYEGQRAKVATDAASVEQADVDALRAVGLTDADVADVVFAVAARSFFTAVLDGLGAQLDEQTAATFPPALRDAMVVGRPVAGG